MITRAELAAMVDHTLLKPESTAQQVADLAREAADLGAYSICVSPSRLDVELPEGVKLATVCGFPSGAHPSEVKAVEAADSVAQGADEVDMVINLGLAMDGDWDGVQEDIEAVRAACPEPTVLKVIIESAALDDEQIVAACRAAEAAGADFVKTRERRAGLVPRGPRGLRAPRGGGLRRPARFRGLRRRCRRGVRRGRLPGGAPARPAAHAARGLRRA